MMKSTVVVSLLLITLLFSCSRSESPEVPEPAKRYVPEFIAAPLDTTFFYYNQDGSLQRVMSRAGLGFPQYDLKYAYNNGRIVNWSLGNGDEGTVYTLSYSTSDFPATIRAVPPVPEQGVRVDSLFFDQQGKPVEIRHRSDYSYSFDKLSWENGLLKKVMYYSLAFSGKYEASRQEFYEYGGKSAVNSFLRQYALDRWSMQAYRMSDNEMIKKMIWTRDDTTVVECKNWKYNDAGLPVSYTETTDSYKNGFSSREFTIRYKEIKQ